MHRILLIVTSLAALLLSACIVAPADRGSRMVVTPLPVVVELGVEPYYYQGGYHYHYDNNRWRYSNSRSGPWTDLPKSHYPKETKFKGRDGGRGGDHDRGNGRGRDHDRGDGRGGDRDRGERR